jgi:hypothetical protein|tara:strand:+ start:346 stop:852 length:507 start_codon:yes stop_codon:yes gene_type:complete
MTHDRDLVIQQLHDYVVNVLEEKRGEFSGLAVCPFVKADRVRDELFLDVFDNKVDTLIDVLLRFVRSRKRSALIAQINTDIASEDTKEYQEFINLVIDSAEVGDVKALCFNPNDNLSIEGYNPRSRAPHFLINMAYSRDLSKAHRSLKQTNYYDKMPEDYKGYLGVKK